jgi:hypothetical protein
MRMRVSAANISSANYSEVENILTQTDREIEEKSYDRAKRLINKALSILGNNDLNDSTAASELKAKLKQIQQLQQSNRRGTNINNNERTSEYNFSVWRGWIGTCVQHSIHPNYRIRLAIIWSIVLFLVILRLFNIDALELVLSSSSGTTSSSSSSSSYNQQSSAKHSIAAGLWHYFIIFLNLVPFCLFFRRAINSRTNVG